jgi:Fe-S-cluster containining protein
MMSELMANQLQTLAENTSKTVRQAAVFTLHPAPTAESIRTAAEQTSQFFDASLQMLDKTQPLDAPVLACRAGCAFCCYLMVTVVAPEAVALATKLRESLSETELAELQQRVTETYQQTEQLNNAERARARIACPLLTDKSECRLYEDRPLDCRGYHSLDRDACEALLADPLAGHPVSPVRQTIGNAIKSGLSQAIFETRLEIPALRYELIEALHRCLADPDAGKKYANGENILQPAVVIADQDSGVWYKIRYAPARLRAEYRRVLAQERRYARKERKGDEKGRTHA